MNFRFPSLDATKLGRADALPKIKKLGVATAVMLATGVAERGSTLMLPPLSYPSFTQRPSRQQLASIPGLKKSLFLQG